MDDVSSLKTLGSNTIYKYEVNSAILETFPNRYDSTKYDIVFRTNEFTSLCPKTGQPDFGEILVTYCPKEKCIESKSLKLYLFSYRNEKSFMETIVNRIADDLFNVCRPDWLQVEGRFNPRGGIFTIVTAHRKS